jgi:hypothetical protein
VRRDVDSGGKDNWTVADSGQEGSFVGLKRRRPDLRWAVGRKRIVSKTPIAVVGEMGVRRVDCWCGCEREEWGKRYTRMRCISFTGEEE